MRRMSWKENHSLIAIYLMSVQNYCATIAASFCKIYNLIKIRWLQMYIALLKRTEGLWNKFIVTENIPICYKCLLHDEETQNTALSLVC